MAWRSTRNASQSVLISSTVALPSASQVTGCCWSTECGALGCKWMSWKALLVVVGGLFWFEIATAAWLIDVNRATLHVDPEAYGWQLARSGGRRRCEKNHLTSQFSFSSNKSSVPWTVRRDRWRRTGLPRGGLNQEQSLTIFCALNRFERWPGNNNSVDGQREKGDFNQLQANYKHLQEFWSIVQHADDDGNCDLFLSNFFLSSIPGE